jgi:hypothetical protein
MHSRSVVYVSSILLGLNLTGCEDQCSSFSANRFNCKQIADANYNVYFNLPDDTELSLGQTTGLSNCAARASNYANQYSVPKRYFCCMITETSSCAEKHR